MPGYTGGFTESPTYEDVCTGKTGHAEAIQLSFDPKIISFEKLVEIFFHLHDPTSLNRQGNDVGTQYRSAIFYHSDEQKKTAEIAKSDIPNAVTEIVPYSNFHKAEDYHRNYYEKNGGAPYCQVVIDPKIQKLLKEYAKDVKQQYR